MLNPDFKDLLRNFKREKVEYLLIGGYAVAAHGYPRATQDLDLLVKPTKNNAKRVHAALVAFGIPPRRIDPFLFARPSVIFQIGVPPWRIDIFTEIPGVAFSAAFRERMEVPVEDLIVSVISKKHLISSKKACGRPQDLLDIDRLKNDVP